jgi:hypothetical protein
MLEVSSILLNTRTCFRPLHHVIMFRETGIRDSTVMLPMTFWIFTSSCYALLILVCCTRSSRKHHKNRSENVRSGHLGGHNPLESTLSPKNSFSISVVVLAVRHVAPSRWILLSHSWSYSKEQGCINTYLYTSEIMHWDIQYSVLYQITGLNWVLCRSLFWKHSSVTVREDLNEV